MWRPLVLRPFKKFVFKRRVSLLPIPRGWKISDSQRSLILAIIIILSFVFSLFPSPQSPVLSSKEVEEYANLLVQGLATTKENAEALVKQAHNLALGVFSDNTAKCIDLRNELLQTFVQAADADVMIIYNSGGWGRASSEEDEHWGSVVREMESTLEEWKYNTIVVDYNRTGDDLSELILECEEVLNSYSYKAKRLATEVKFITQHNSQLKVIITGLSQGAAYVNEVMELLKSNQQVYGIIAGLPFYSQGNDSDRLRVISDNGISPDALTHGDLPALIKTLFTAQFRWIKDGLRGGLLGIGGYLDPPGHQYLWSLPEVRSQVMSFLQKNFGGKT